MTKSDIQDSPLKPLPGRVMVAGLLTSIGALALDGIEPSRQLLSFFQAGMSAGKTAAPEFGGATGASACADGVLKNPDNQKQRS